jgi:hypothetical protein
MNNQPLKILSDGEKIAFIIDGKSYILDGAVVSNFDFQTKRSVMDITRFGDETLQMMAGPASTTLNLSIVGGLLTMTDQKDIFNQTKMIKYTKKINQEVKELVLKRSLEF